MTLLLLLLLLLLQLLQQLVVAEQLKYHAACNRLLCMIETSDV